MQEINKRNIENYFYSNFITGSVINISLNVRILFNQIFRGIIKSILAHAWAHGDRSVSSIDGNHCHHMKLTIYDSLYRYTRGTVQHCNTVLTLYVNMNYSTTSTGKLIILSSYKKCHTGNHDRLKRTTHRAYRTKHMFPERETHQSAR